jgi:hypothetical protein
LMHIPYSRAVLFLTYIKGDRTEDWAQMMTRHLNFQVRSGVSLNVEALWDYVYDSF